MRKYCLLILIVAIPFTAYGGVIPILVVGGLKMVGVAVIEVVIILKIAPVSLIMLVAVLLTFDDSGGGGGGDLALMLG